MAITDTLDATIKALHSGPKKIPVPAAIQNIDTWEKELASHHSAHVKSVIADLGKLKGLLKASAPDDAAISTLLHKLSTDTTAVAGDEKTDVAHKLKELGKLLAHGV